MCRLQGARGCCRDPLASHTSALITQPTLITSHSPRTCDRAPPSQHNVCTATIVTPSWVWRSGQRQARDLQILPLCLEYVREGGDEREQGREGVKGKKEKGRETPAFLAIRWALHRLLHHAFMCLLFWRLSAVAYRHNGLSPLLLPQMRVRLGISC